jgi:hypothetical protein
MAGHLRRRGPGTTFATTNEDNDMKGSK